MEKISVSIRVRPLDKQEAAKGIPWNIADKTISLCNPSGSIMPGQTYTFDSVFGTDSSNLQLYEACTKDIVASAVNGFNGTVFAYGQTSSGKTYTMRGSKQEPGIIPMAVHDTFRNLQLESDREFLLRMSYMEIYNEEINDLLAPDSCKLQVHESLERGIFVAGLREEIVATPEQVLQLMEFGETNRHVGETNMNVYSSRSHTIFRMVIESRDKTQDNSSGPICDAVRVSVLNLVDLAGSERIAKTGAEGSRLKEGTHINKSLMTLGTVINKLSEGIQNQGGHVPYRDSKLTRILQPALGGNAKTTIICNITPALIHVDETKGTLQFASRAIRVTNCAKVNEVLTDAALLKRQTKEIEELRNKLKESHSDHLEEEILSLRNTLLKIELEREQIALELEEQKKVQAEREQRIKEQAKKIENLSTMVLNSAVDDREFDKPSKKNTRRETWCPRVASDSSLEEDDIRRPSNLCSKVSLSDVTLFKRDRSFPMPLPFDKLLEEDESRTFDEFENFGGALSLETCKEGDEDEGHDVDCMFPESSARKRKLLTEMTSTNEIKEEVLNLQARHQDLESAHELEMRKKTAEIENLKKCLAHAEMAANKTRKPNLKSDTSQENDRRAKSLEGWESDSVVINKHLEEQVQSLQMEKFYMQRDLDRLMEQAKGQTSFANEGLEELSKDLAEAKEEAFGYKQELQAALNKNAQMEKEQENESALYANLLAEVGEIQKDMERVISVVGELEIIALDNKQKFTTDIADLKEIMNDMHNLTQFISICRQGEGTLAEQKEQSGCKKCQNSNWESEKENSRLIERVVEDINMINPQISSILLDSTEQLNCELNVDTVSSVEDKNLVNKTVLSEYPQSEGELCLQDKGYEQEKEELDKKKLGQLVDERNRALALLMGLQKLSEQNQIGRSEVRASSDIDGLLSELQEITSESLNLMEHLLALGQEKRVVRSYSEGLESKKGVHFELLCFIQTLIAECEDMKTILDEHNGDLGFKNVFQQINKFYDGGSAKREDKIPNIAEEKQLDSQNCESNIQKCLHSDVEHGVGEEALTIAQEVARLSDLMKHVKRLLCILSEENIKLKEETSTLLQECGSLKNITCILQEEHDKLLRTHMEEKVVQETFVSKDEKREVFLHNPDNESNLKLPLQKNIYEEYLHGKEEGSPFKMLQLSEKEMQILLQPNENATEQHLAIEKSIDACFPEIEGSEKNEKVLHAGEDGFQLLQEEKGRFVVFVNETALIKADEKREMEKIKTAFQNAATEVDTDNTEKNENIAYLQAQISKNNAEASELFNKFATESAALKARIMELEDVKVSLDSKLSMSDLEIEALNASLYKSSMEIQELKQHYQHEVSQLRSELVTLRKETKSAKAAPSVLEKEKEALRKDLEKGKSKLKETELKLKSAIQDKCKLETEKANMERELKHLRGQSSLLQRDITRRESMADKKRESIAFGLTKAKSQITSFEQALQMKNIELEKANFELQILQGQCADTDVEIDSLKEKLEKAEKEFFIVNEEKEQAKANAEKLLAELQEASECLGKTRTEFEALQAISSNLNEDFQACKNSCDLLEKSISELTKEKEDLASQLTDAYLLFEEEKAAMAAMNKGTVDTLVKEHETKCQSYLERITHLTGDLDNAKLDLNSTEERCVLLQEQISSVKLIAEEAENARTSESLQVALLTEKISQLGEDFEQEKAARTSESLQVALLKEKISQLGEDFEQEKAARMKETLHSTELEDKLSLMEANLSRIHVLEMELSEVGVMMDKLCAEKTAAEAQVSELEETLRKETQQLLASKQEIEHLRKEKQQAFVDMQNLRKQNDMDTEEQISKESENKNLIDQLTSDLHAAQEDLNNIKENKEKREKELQSNLSKIMEEIQETRSNYMKLSEANKTILKEKQCLAIDHLKLQVSFNAAVEKSEVFYGRLQEARDEIQILHESNLSHRINEQMKEELARAKVQIVELKVEAKNYSEQLEILNRAKLSRRDQESSEYEVLKMKKISELVLEKDALQEQLTKAEENVKVLSAEVNHLNFKVRVGESTTTKLQDSLKELQNQKLKLENKVVEFQQQLKNNEADRKKKYLDMSTESRGLHPESGLILQIQPKSLGFNESKLDGCDRNSGRSGEVRERNGRERSAAPILDSWRFKERQIGGGQVERPLLSEKLQERQIGDGQVERPLLSEKSERQIGGGQVERPLLSDKSVSMVGAKEDTENSTSLPSFPRRHSVLEERPGNERRDPPPPRYWSTALKSSDNSRISIAARMRELRARNKENSLGTFHP